VKNELAEVARFASRAEAEVAATVLDADGVPSAIDCDDAGGMQPWLRLISPVRLLVPPDLLERARELLGPPPESP